MTLRISSRSLAFRRAFTMVEMMIAVGLVVVVGGALVLCNLFGLSMSMRQQIWMAATSDSARTMGYIMNDVRAGQIIAIGNYVNNSFVPVPDGTNQWGDAVRIYYSTATNTPPWVDYYYSSTTSNLVRTNYNGAGIVGSSSAATANPITNDSRVFTFENYAGTVYTNSVTMAVVDVYLSYIKLQNPEVVIAQGNLVDLYQIRTKIVPRVRP